MEQLFMFGQPPAKQEVRRTITRRQFGPEPKQKKLRIKLQRKIAYKKRVYEDPNARNEYHWGVEGIARIHVALFEDWHERFGDCKNREELIDYWFWMLGDPTEAFSFHDCLVAAGYSRPQEVIDQITNHIPDWLESIIDRMSDDVSSSSQARHNIPAAVAA